MTVDPAAPDRMTCDELDAVVSMLCARFPERGMAEVERLASAVYQQLACAARIRAHLIPLTLNRCRRILSACPSATSESRDVDVSEAAEVVALLRPTSDHLPLGV